MYLLTKCFLIYVYRSLILLSVTSLILFFTDLHIFDHAIISVHVCRPC